MGIYQMLPLPASVEQGPMEMKWYSAFPKLQDIKTQHQII